MLSDTFTGKHSKFLWSLLQGASLGYELLAHVFAHLDILETDYFGLQYTDEKSVTRWIDQDKSIKKQTCKQRGKSYSNKLCSCQMFVILAS